MTLDLPLSLTRVVCPVILALYYVQGKTLFLVSVTFSWCENGGDDFQVILMLKIKEKVHESVLISLSNTGHWRMKSND